MQKLFHSPLFRAIRPQHFTPASTFTSFSDHSLDNFNTANEVVTLINSVHPIEPPLGNIVPLLNREVVVSVLQSQAQLNKDPRIFFRFFIWAAGRARFRSGVSHKLIVDMLLKGANGNSFDLYWSVLDELRNANLPIYDDAFVVLILGYWRLRKAEKAVETFGRMKDYDCKPNLAAYNVILHVLVQKEVMLLALAIYNSMLKLNLRIGCDTFNVLIDGLCKSGMIQDALKLFDEMIDRGVEPNEITHTVVISGLCKAKRIHDAHRLFNMMKSNGSRPGSAMHNALLDGFCKCGQIDEAFMLFKSFKDDGHNIGIRGFSSLINGLVRAKRIREAEYLFQRIIDAGLVPDLVLYTTMMCGLTKAGRMRDATNMLQDMIERGIMPDTRCYNVLIKGFCDLGLLDQARSLKLEISQQGQFPSTCTYTMLICGLCRNGLLGEAQQIFNEMETHGCSPSVVTFNALIDGFCKTGNLGEAHLTLYKMEIGKNPSLFLRLSQGADRILDSASLQKTVENLVDSGLILKAYKLLTQLADSTVDPNIRTYNILINGMCKAGQVNKALKLFEDLQHKGHSPDSVTYATLIEGLQRVDREEDSYKLFERMNLNRCKPSSSVFKTLMVWSCRRKKSRVAFGIWLKYLRSLGSRDEETLKYIEECFGNGELEKALRSLLEMDMKLADFDSGPYNIWLVGLCQASRVEAASNTFSMLEEFKVNISAAGCVKLIRALCSEGNLSKAYDVILYSMQKGYRLNSEVFNTLLKLLLNSKYNSSLAFELVDKMKVMGYDLNYYLSHVTKSLLHRHCSVR